MAAVRSRRIPNARRASATAIADEEISVFIEESKTLIIKLINVGELDKNGQRSVNIELDGSARPALVNDKTLAGEKVAHAEDSPSKKVKSARRFPQCSP